MARIILQMGHVPRKRGATGTWREQEFARAVVAVEAKLLSDRGHRVTVIGADDAAPHGDVFISHHGDSGTARVSGPGRSSRRGGSVGYPDSRGRQLAHRWKYHHARRGFPSRPAPQYLNDNFTIGLARYYMWRRTSHAYRFLAEHGTFTNTIDERYVFGNVYACAMAHVDAIGDVVGHPRNIDTPTPTIPEPEDDEIMKMGDRGEHVRNLQVLLAATWEGRATDLVPKDKAKFTDGIFGEETRRAVLRAKHYLRLPSDPEHPEVYGDADPAFVGALAALYAEVRFGDFPHNQRSELERLRAAVSSLSARVDELATNR